MSDTQELTFEERLLLEGYKELLLEMRQVGEEAPDGTVLDCMEGLVLGKGRELLRRSLENQLQTAAESAEKKGSRHAPSAKRRPAAKGRDNEKF